MTNPEPTTAAGRARIVDLQAERDRLQERVKVLEGALKRAVGIIERWHDECGDGPLCRDPKSALLLADLRRALTAKDADTTQRVSGEGEK